MAIAINGTPTVDNYSSATTSVVVTMPSGIVAGEKLCTFLICASGTSLGITAPDGTWTQEARVNYQATTLSGSLYVRDATGSEASTYTYTLDASVIVTAYTFRVSGHNTSTFADVTYTANGGNSTTPTATGLTTVTDGAMALILMGAGTGTYAPHPPGAPWTTVLDANGGARGYSLAYQIKSTAGAISDAVGSLTAARTWVAMMFAIRPASAAALSGTASIRTAISRNGWPALVTM